ncbi:hypothetical protein EDC04DRAFT_2780104, partial [Pisolithus marmoratus]
FFSLLHTHPLITVVFSPFVAPFFFWLAVRPFPLRCASFFSLLLAFFSCLFFLFLSGVSSLVSFFFCGFLWEASVRCVFTVTLCY